MSVPTRVLFALFGIGWITIAFVEASYGTPARVWGFLAWFECLVGALFFVAAFWPKRWL